MEISEYVLLVALGFGPTLGALEIAWRIGLKRATTLARREKVESGYLGSFVEKKIEEKEGLLSA